MTLEEEYEANEDKEELKRHHRDFDSVSLSAAIANDLVDELIEHLFLTDRAAFNKAKAVRSQIIEIRNVVG